MPYSKTLNHKELIKLKISIIYKVKRKFRDGFLIFFKLFWNRVTRHLLILDLRNSGRRSNLKS